MVLELPETCWNLEYFFKVHLELLENAGFPYFSNIWKILNFSLKIGHTPLKFVNVCCSLRSQQ